MKAVSTSKKPAHHTEQALIEAILNGTFSPGHRLPPERELASQLGVTRPTLRETLKQLDRDGWLNIRQGKPTLVNDYWKHGGLNVLNGLVRSGAPLSAEFVTWLLEVRLVLAPAYTKAAVTGCGNDIVALLGDAERLDAEPRSWCEFDWQLHHQLCVWSGNPVYALILNGFKNIYLEMGAYYFQEKAPRDGSAAFYKALMELASKGNASQAAELTAGVMEESLQYWKTLQEEPS